MNSNQVPPLDVAVEEIPVVQQSETTQSPLAAALAKNKKNSGKFDSKKLTRILLIVLGIFVVVGGIFGLVAWKGYQEVQGFLSLAREVETPAREAYEALKTQNLTESKAKLAVTAEKYTNLRSKYDQYGWMRAVPFVNAYYGDGTHALNAGQAGVEAAQIAIEAVEPYADVLGFAGEGTFTGGSIENRIKLMLGTLSKVTPVVDQLSAKLDTVGTELAQIDENRYPEEIQGVQIRSKLATAKVLSAGASDAVLKAKPVLEVLPSVAGADGLRKKYLVIFQNDNELRPTGGFMTAYATLFVEDGRVTPEKSDDIYELDKKFRNKPVAPDILKKYLKTETTWNLRDMNLSPDLKNSMDIFWSYFEKVPNEPKDINGIILVDTNVLEKLVEILGPVEVPGYGTFSSEIDKRCDCPQIIYALSEIVDRPTPYLRTDRKGIIGPMMQAILAKAYSAPKNLWPALFGEAWSSIEGKHVQFYFFDEKVQAAAESINAAGRVQATPENSDYLFIVDTNLGGAKSNLFVEQSVEQDVELPVDGRIKKTITLTYKNPFEASNCNLEAGELCLNGKLTDWVRIYLPKGAEIVESLGFDEGSPKTTEELDHAMFEGVFTLLPLNQTKVKLTYTVPYTNATTYRVFMQKQGGTHAWKHTMRVNGSEVEVMLDKDKVVELPF